MCAGAKQQKAGLGRTDRVNLHVLATLAKHPALLLLQAARPVCMEVHAPGATESQVGGHRPLMH